MQQTLSTHFGPMTPSTMHLGPKLTTAPKLSAQKTSSVEWVSKLAYHSQLSGWLVFIDPPAHLDCDFLAAHGVDWRKILIVRSSKSRTKARCLALALESIHTRLVVCDSSGLQGASLKALKQAAKMGMGSAILLDGSDMAHLATYKTLH